MQVTHSQQPKQYNNSPTIDTTTTHNCLEMVASNSEFEIRKGIPSWCNSPQILNIIWPTRKPEQPDTTSTKLPLKAGVFKLTSSFISILLNYAHYTSRRLNSAPEPTLPILMLGYHYQSGLPLPEWVTTTRVGCHYQRQQILQDRPQFSHNHWFAFSATSNNSSRVVQFVIKVFWPYDEKSVQIV